MLFYPNHNTTEMKSSRKIYDFVYTMNKQKIVCLWIVPWEIGLAAVLRVGQLPWSVKLWLVQSCVSRRTGATTPSLECCSIRSSAASTSTWQALESSVSTSSWWRSSTTSCRGYVHTARLLRWVRLSVCLSVGSHYSKTPPTGRSLGTMLCPSENFFKIFGSKWVIFVQKVCIQAKKKGDIAQYPLPFATLRYWLPRCR